MERAGGSAFALHFDYFGHRAEDVGAPLIAPLIGPFAHRRRRRDGVDGDDFVGAIGHVAHRFIPVHGYEFS